MIKCGEKPSSAHIQNTVGYRYIFSPSVAD